MAGVEVEQALHLLRREAELVCDGECRFLEGFVVGDALRQIRAAELIAVG